MLSKITDSLGIIFSRINFSGIIRSHFATFISLDTGKIIPLDILLMVGAPITLSMGLIFFDISLANIMSDLIKVIAFFGAFLFNLLALIYNLRDKIRQSAKGDPVRLKFAKYIHANISYAILISIFMVILFIIYEIILNKEVHWIIDKIYTTIIVALLIHYLLTLIMILVNIYVILKIDEGEE